MSISTRHDQVELISVTIVSEAHAQVGYICLVNVIAIRSRFPVVCTNPVHLDLQQASKGSTSKLNMPSTENAHTDLAEELCMCLIVQCKVRNMPQGQSHGAARLHLLACVPHCYTSGVAYVPDVGSRCGAHCCGQSHTDRWRSASTPAAQSSLLMYSLHMYTATVMTVLCAKLCGICISSGVRSL